MTVSRHKNAGSAREPSSASLDDLHEAIEYFLVHMHRYVHFSLQQLVGLSDPSQAWHSDLMSVSSNPSKHICCLHPLFRCASISETAKEIREWSDAAAWSRPRDQRPRNACIASKIRYFVHISMIIQPTLSRCKKSHIRVFDLRYAGQCPGCWNCCREYLDLGLLSVHHYFPTISALILCYSRATQIASKCAVDAHQDSSRFIPSADRE